MRDLEAGAEGLPPRWRVRCERTADRAGCRSSRTTRGSSAVRFATGSWDVRPRTTTSPSTATRGGWRARSPGAPGGTRLRCLRDSARGAWSRVIAAGRSICFRSVGHSIEADLAARDLTINAIAQPLAGGEYVDPFGGLSDLGARRIRMVSARAFADDPLRTIRVARLACELEFDVEPDTAAAARANSAGARACRGRADLRRAQADRDRRPGPARAGADGCRLAPPTWSSRS